MKIIAAIADDFWHAWVVMLVLGWVHSDIASGVPALPYWAVFILIQCIGILQIPLVQATVND